MVLALLLAASVTACGKKGGGGSGGGETGVPECDDYLAKMDACAKKMGEKGGGPQLTKMADMMRGSWKDDVKDKDKKAGMPDGCRSAIKDMKKSMPDCDWGGAADPAPAGSAAAAPAGGVQRLQGRDRITGEVRQAPPGDARRPEAVVRPDVGGVGEHPGRGQGRARHRVQGGRRCREAVGRCLQLAHPRQCRRP